MLTKDLLKEKKMDEHNWFVHDIWNAGCNLEPCHCYVCGEPSVIYNQSVSDGYCELCGEWQAQHHENLYPEEKEDEQEEKSGAAE